MAQKQINKHIHTCLYSFILYCKLLFFIFIFCSICSFLYTQCSSAKATAVTRQKNEQRTVFQKVSKSRNVFWIREAAGSNTECSCRLRSAKQQTRMQWFRIWMVTLRNLCRHCQYNFFKKNARPGTHTHTHQKQRERGREGGRGERQTDRQRQTQREG